MGNIGKNFKDRGIGNRFLNRTLINQEIIAKWTNGIAKSKSFKLKKLLHIKGNNY
jgi:hypothetical protein